jgi:hypothetical protein
MATTQNNYTGNGSNKLFSITFPYLDTPDIDVYLNGTLQTVTTQYFFANATTIEFVTAPANGATITLIRVTPDLSPEATFFPGSSIKASDLNDNFDQIFYIAQETVNRADTAVSTANLALPKAGGTMTGAIVLAADPSTNLQAATKQYVDAVGAGAAGLALLKTGGTMTGNLVFAAGQPTATTSTKGIVQLTDSVSSTSTTTAATPAAVKVAQDTADAAQTTGTNALPKSGGTMTGAIVMPVGSTLVPSLSFTSDVDTGIFSAGAGRFDIVSDGYTKLEISTTSTTFVNPSIHLINGTNFITFMPGASNYTIDNYDQSSGGWNRSHIRAYDHIFSTTTTGSSTFNRLTIANDGTVDIPGTLTKGGSNVVTVGDTGTVTSTMILNGTIVDGDINASAAIVDTKLATIATAGKVSNSATTATNANTASAIVARDASGNFSAGTITASLTGNASTVTTNANLTGDVTSVGNATTIAAGVIVDADVNASAAIVDTKLATIATAGKVSNSATTATNVNTASAIVARDASGNFTAGTITAALTGAASSNVLKAGDTMTGVLAVTAGTAALPGIAVSGDPNTGIYSPGADQLAISTNGTGRLFVNSSGQVGINGAPPAWASSSSISVNEAAFSPALSYVGGEGELTHNAYYDGAWKYSGTGYQASRIQLGIQGAISFLNTPTIGTAGGAITWQERLRITSGGLVGIGTSSPGAPLNVRFDNAGTTTVALFENQRSVGGSPDAAQIVVGARTYNHTIIRQNSDQGTQAIGGTLDTVISNTFGADLHIATGSPTNAARLTVTSAGLVGIGTTSPGAALDVRSRDLHLGATSGGAGLITFRRNSGTQSGYFGWDSGSDLVMRWGNDSGSGRLAFNTNGQEKMRLDENGRLLVGTSSARGGFDNNSGVSSNLQVEGAGTAAGGTRTALSIVNNGSADADSAGLYLARSGGTAVGSFTAVTADDALGRITFSGADGTEFVTGASIEAAVDGTPGANDLPSRLVFSTTADGASSPTERMRISQNGQVQVSNALDSFLILSTASAGTSNYLLAGNNNAATAIFIYSNGNVVNTNNSYGAISDIKLKENISDANSQWDDLKALQVRKYNFKEGQTHTQIGLIAQEAELVSPGLVSESPDRDDEGNDLGTVTKLVNYSVLYMKAVKALQEAMERIEQLEQRLTDAGIA